MTSNAARALARKQAREARAAQRNGKKRKRKWSKQPPSPADTGRPGRQFFLAERVEISPGVAVATVGVQTDFVFYLLADAPGDDSESSSNTGDVCLTPVSEPEGRPYSDSNRSRSLERAKKGAWAGGCFTPGSLWVCAQQ